MKTTSLTDTADAVQYYKVRYTYVDHYSSFKRMPPYRDLPFRPYEFINAKQLNLKEGIIIYSKLREHERFTFYTGAREVKENFYIGRVSPEEYTAIIFNLCDKGNSLIVYYFKTSDLKQPGGKGFIENFTKGLD